MSAASYASGRPRWQRRAARLPQGQAELVSPSAAAKDGSIGVSDQRRCPRYPPQRPDPIRRGRRPQAAGAGSGSTPRQRSRAPSTTRQRPRFAALRAASACLGRPHSLDGQRHTPRSPRLIGRRRLRATVDRYMAISSAIARGQQNDPEPGDAELHDLGMRGTSCSPTPVPPALAANSPPTASSSPGTRVRARQPEHKH
jgi:hypothetical protein